MGGWVGGGVVVVVERGGLFVELARQMVLQPPGPPARPPSAPHVTAGEMQENAEGLRWGITGRYHIGHDPPLVRAKRGGVGGGQRRKRMQCKNK